MPCNRENYVQYSTVWNTRKRMCLPTKILGRFVPMTMRPLDHACTHYPSPARHFWHGPCVRLVYRNLVFYKSRCDSHRVHIEWQRPLSGVHYFMRGGVPAHPLSLYLPSCTKLQCTLQLRGQIHLHYVISTPKCTLWR